MKIGIIGTGTIASAIVTGFCTKEIGHEFYLSPRGAKHATALAEKFQNVTVCTTNQEVLDKADYILITLQKSGFYALEELSFKSEHKVINCATEMKLETLKEIIGETALLAHIVPLPMIVNGFGPLIAYPELNEVKELFSPVSDVLFVESLDVVRPLQMLTCIMSPYYMLLEEFAKFTDEHGIDHKLSVDFIHCLFSSLSRRAALSPDGDLVELAHDMTPGGYNEQAMNELMDNGAIPAWGSMLRTLLGRLEANDKK